MQVNGEKSKIRLADIAEDVGVSIVTVAKVLHQTGGKNARVGKETAAKIRACADRLQYCPNMAARQLAGKSSGLIGVVVDSCAPQAYYQMLSKIEFYASQEGYRIMIAQAHEDFARIKAFARDFAAYGADGVICLAHSYPGESEEIVRTYSENGKTVFWGTPECGGSFYSVDHDLLYTYREVITFLFEQGRRRIGLLLGDSLVSRSNMQQREMGYRNGLKQYGIPYDSGLIKRIPFAEYMDEHDTMDVVTDLVRNHGVDAIVACNDQLAAMALKNLAALGVRVPDEVAVTGFDNIDVARLVTPALTTFDFGYEQIARELVHLLSAQIHHQDIPVKLRKVKIISPLIRRQSA